MTLFKSFCNIPVVAAKNDVIAPTKVITIKAVGEYSNKGEHLAIIKTPAVTIVAAWIKADTGVGYSLKTSYASIRQRNTILEH
jgi:hypothetical protein